MTIASSPPAGRAARGGRPKGYIDWHPNSEWTLVIDQVNQILNRYRTFGPMTVRQIFYNLVAAHGYPKDERAYKRLAENLVKARRAGHIPFQRIRDDGTIVHNHPVESTRRQVWEYLQDIVGRPGDFLRLDRNQGQPYHIEIWCEAAGMAPMLAQMVRDRDISVYSTGGFSSVTVTWEVAQRIADRTRPTYLLHIGDYDPSGESIFRSMAQDIGAFVQGEYGGTYVPETGAVLRHGELFFAPQRVALTEAQVSLYNLPTAPPKLSDSRSSNWVGETTQAEAIPPDLLEQIVQAAVADLTDADALAAVELLEQQERARLQAAVEQHSVAELIDQQGLQDPSLLELVQAIARHELRQQ